MLNNFQFHVPTEIIFGKDTHLQVGKLLAERGFHKILLHYGGGSIHKTGLYDAVVGALAESNIAFVELGGVEPNPKVSLVREGAALCRREGVELILAVGGGSVLDSAKVMAESAATGVDPWEFSSKKQVPAASLPVAAILTLAASGSEMSASAVLTNEDGALKRGFNSPFHRPLFSICNPELTYTVNRFQTGCGIVDIMMHTLERYFTVTENVDLTERIAEGLLKAVIDAGKVAIAEPENYEARATLMWAGSLSHNDLTGCGCEVCMNIHQLEHELSGIYDFVAHGAGLSVLFPAWAKYVYRHNIPKFCRYAVEVWGCTMDEEHPEKTALEGITKTEEYFVSLGMPVHLSELGVGDDRLEEMAEKCTFWGARTLKDYIELGKQEILEIFELAK